MLELVPVVSTGSRSVGGLDSEASDGHRGEQGPETEQGKVKEVLLLLEELLFVPVGGDDPEDEAEGGGGGDRVVGGC